MNNPLTILQLNIRGIRFNLEEVETLLRVHSPDVAIFYRYDTYPLGRRSSRTCQTRNSLIRLDLVVPTKIETLGLVPSNAVGTYSGADQKDPEDFFTRFTKAANEYKMESHIRKTSLHLNTSMNFDNRPKLHVFKVIQKAILKKINGDSARANLLYKFCATKLANLDEDHDTFLTTHRDIWRRIIPEPRSRCPFRCCTDY